MDDASSARYTLRLFIAGATPRSRMAVFNVRRICEVLLTGRADLEIVDIYQQPHLAAAHNITAFPTLLKLAPAPVRRIPGLLSDENHVLRGLDLV